MSISRAEFVRGLNRLANEMESLSQKGESEWELCAPNGRIGVTFSEKAPRTIGALTLPRATVTLDLQALPQAQRTAFSRRFRLAFQRGGG